MQSSSVAHSCADANRSKCIICFAIRVRKTSRVLNDSGERVRLEKLGNFRKRHFETMFYDMKIKLDHKSINKGEYLFVISSLDCPDGFKSYKRRWDIERCFKGCKTSGFNMEQTQVKSKKRFINFIKCIFIALRFIAIRHPDQMRKNPLVLVSNDCKSDASVIADWYKQRWSVELVFKWLKQNLKLKTFSILSSRLFLPCQIRGSIYVSQ